MKRLASAGVDVVSCVRVNHDAQCDVSEWPVILAKPADGPERARRLFWGTCANPFLGPSPASLIACISRNGRVSIAILGSLHVVE